jgi:diguanylate cyclase (GGDEF)-like protein
VSTSNSTQDDLRSTLIDQIDTLLNAPHQAVIPFAVCVVDIDRLHALQQTLDEPAAVDMLACIGARLQHAARTGDTVTRIGTGTYALLLPGAASKLELEQLLRGLLLVIATPISLPMDTVAVTASIGTDLYSHDAQQTDTLSQCADQAMTVARCEGGDGFRFFSPPVSRLASGHYPQLKHDGEVSRTLLLVDDEPSILSALTRVLRREGYTIFTAENGETALDILAAHPVQVIVSDQRMPGMTGMELLVRVHELYPDTRRIILSGYLNIPVLTDAVKRGTVWKYFGKPWDDEELRSEIGHAFAIDA